VSEQAASPQSPSPPPARRCIVFLPLLIFIALAAVFMLQLMSGRDASTVPSALIGEKAPAMALPPLEGLRVPGLNSSDLVGKVTVLNVFASWCVPCRQEHPVLLELSQDKRFALAGLNYKDQPENARRFLGELGSPYAAIGMDDKGRAAIDWGVYGVPETFVIGRDGIILHKHVGPLTPEAVRAEIMPEIERALAAQ
jgi:cytochrome c biogenesis protein CcmG/thiol:disulfide interchange protein DsbE